MITPKAEFANCHECPLQKERCALTHGNKDAKVAIISRSPGSYDVRSGVPFSGPSGKVLDHLLTRYGYLREEVLVTNLVLCYTDDPPKQAIEACRARLQSEVQNAKTLIVAGSEAVREFIGNVSITKARGLEHTKGTQRIIATNNPAAVLYDSDSFPNLVEDFRLALDPPPPVTYPTVNIVDDGKSFLEELWDYKGIIATDLEGRNSHIECAGFSIMPNEAFVLTRRTIVENWDLFKKFYQKKKHWLWHNGIYDCKLLRRNSITSSIVDDTYPLSYVLDERTQGVHGLKYLARTQLGWKNYEPESVDAYFETGELPLDVSELYEYNGYDCAATLQIFYLLQDRAKDDNVWKLYKDHMIPLMNALVDIELRGFRYDHIAAADLNEEIVIPELRKLTSQMREIVGLELFKPSSPKQVSAYVYDTCGLVHSLKSTRKRSFERSFSDPVRVEILEGRFDCKPKYKKALVQFAELHDAFAEIDKQRGTYIEGLIKLVGEDGRLYCSFNPCGTVTGRTSSRTPNFQNITRTEKNVVPAIRSLFKPSDGNVIISADYSQAELRCIALFSGDRELLSIYRDTNRSLHRETAAAFYGSNYTKDEYVKSKNINFGVCYGQSAFSFAQMYHMPQEEAQAYIDAWFKKFPDVLKWISQTQKTILKENYLVNPFGRKRRFYLITEENIGDTLREGVNFLPQSTASEFTVSALCELNAKGVPIISTVHDSIIADVPKVEAEEVATLMKKIMESQSAQKLGWNDISFIADVSISDKSWGECEEMEIT